MTEREIQRMKEKLAWEAKKLKDIDMRMHDLRIERARIV